MHAMPQLCVCVFMYCRTVASAFIAADEDQCNEALAPIFGKKHSCDMETTFCLRSEPNRTIDTDNNNLNSNLNSNSNDNNNNKVKQPTVAAYKCLCNFGYYVPNQTLQGFEGHEVESGSGGNYTCIRCPDPCTYCDENGECNDDDSHDNVTLETFLRCCIGVVLGACILCCLILAALVFRQRKCKVRRVYVNLLWPVKSKALPL